MKIELNKYEVNRLLGLVNNQIEEVERKASRCTGFDRDILEDTKFSLNHIKRKLELSLDYTGDQN